MKLRIQQYGFKDYIYLLFFLVFALLENEGVDELLENIGEFLNSLWIVVVLIYVLIPRFLYQAKHWQFFLLYGLAIYFGVFIMEVIIEDDTSILDALSWFALEHEGPKLIGDTGMIAAIKLAVDYGRRQNQLVRLQKEQAETEALFLRSQLNPHVLFNNLNNLYSFALHKSEHTAPMILKLAEIMRYMLYEANQNRVELTKELSYVENFIELQKIQLEGRGEIIYEVHGNTEDLRIAPMMLISFIENCFKHSADTKTDGLRIIIRIEVNGNKLDLYTENSFERQESDEEDALKVGGIGLKNVERRLELIYPKKHQLLVKELKQLYIVSLSIELY